MFSLPFQALSTRIRIFLKTKNFFLCFRKEISVRTERIRIVFARPHVNTKAMEIRWHPSQAMSSMMYEIIVFENLRFRPFKRKR